MAIIAFGIACNIYQIENECEAYRHLKTIRGEMMNDKYILDENGNPKKEENLMKWAEQFKNTDRIIAVTKIDKIVISTVFLGIDHSFGEDKPLLFETMVFGGTLDMEQERYHTKKEALEGHKKMVGRVLGRNYMKWQELRGNPERLTNYTR